MSYLREALVAWLEWTLTAVFGWLVAFRLAWAWVKGDLRESGVRDVPSHCLHDPALGRHKFIKIQSLKLHYVEAGNPENPLVVMIHGAPDFWFTWRRQIPALSHDYWVVAVDLRGCGDSDGPRLRTKYTTPHLAEDIAHLIRALGSRTAHLVCAGLGGLVGWYMCYHYPHLVSKMVLIHSPHPYVIRQHFHSLWMNYYKAWYLFFVRLPVLPEVVAHLDDVCMVDSLLAPLVKNKAITDEEVEAYKFNFSRREDWTGPLHHLRQLDLRGVRETEPLPDVVTKPTLLFMGDADPLLPLDTAYRSAGLGYLAHVSRALQVNQVIGEFLRELPWRPLSPLKSTTSAPSSLVGRVMGASLAAVSSTVNKTTEALEMTRSLPGGFMTAAQASLKVAESKLGLDNFY